MAKLLRQQLAGLVAASTPPPMEKLRVLLVEDDEDDYILTREILEECEGTRFEVEWSNGFDQALEAIRQGRHDVYLVDYRLGPKSGLDLLRQAIAADCPAPLIMLTGQGDREVDLEAMRAGAADYMVKGQIDAPLLERAIRYAVERQRAAKEREELIAELQQALTNIKTLRGLLPICSYCKKIRDDQGYWKQVEEYLRDHTGADFTHGMCPDCYQKMIAEIESKPGKVPAVAAPPKAQA